MNQTNFDLNNDKNKSKFVGERTSNFVKGLGAYFAGVLTNISLLIVIAIFFGWKAIEMTGLFSYLAFSILYLVLYSAATTKTTTISLGYKLMQVIKRFFDIVIAASYIFFCMPLFLLLSLAIRIESPGPILFRSRRVGQFGKMFDKYKFRTMYLAPAEQKYTRTGKFLRRFYLNELPAFINVLNGEMSIVGPWPRIAQDLEETVDSEGKILSVKPGITGLGQILVSSNKDKVSNKDMVNVDLQYVQNWSLVLDIRIMFKTLLFVFRDD